MSDARASTSREEPHDDAHEAVRDALPALLHGRVTASERAALERHLAGCGACDAELQTLASARALYAASAPTVAVDRIAAAVRARTIAAAPTTPARDAFVVRSGRVRTVDQGRTGEPHAGPFDATTRTSRLPAWTRSGALRAVAASALLAIGSGALLYRTPSGAPARDAAAALSGSSVGTAPRPTAHDPSGTLLGASFADLSDTELAAVVAAVDDPASSAPAAEPAASPGVLTPDGE